MCFFNSKFSTRSKLWWTPAKFWTFYFQSKALFACQPVFRFRLHEACSQFVKTQRCRSSVQPGSSVLRSKWLSHHAMPARCLLQEKHLTRFPHTAPVTTDTAYSGAYWNMSGIFYIARNRNPWNGNVGHESVLSQDFGDGRIQTVVNFLDDSHSSATQKRLFWSVFLYVSMSVCPPIQPTGQKLLLLLNETLI